MATEDPKRVKVDTSMKDLLASTPVLSSPPEDGSPYICTHHGTFHCDEALACGMLKLLPQFRDLPIVRTRDMDIIKGATIVVDVGGEYDAASQRFDHHQRTFSDVYDEKYSIKMSSAGLVYKHFGPDIIRAAIGAPDLTDDVVGLMVRQVYKSFIREVDAIDNGVPASETPMTYTFNTTLSARVGRLNPNWNDEQTPEIENKLFVSAVQTTFTEFLSITLNLFEAWLPARAVVEAAFAGAASLHASGRVLQLKQACPWKSHLFTLEEEMDKKGHVLYVLFPDSRGTWRIQCVPEEPSSFTNRKSLPEPWRGIRDDALSELVGVPGAVFVHAGGFIGGHKTFEGALSMATQALDA